MGVLDDLLEGTRAGGGVFVQLVLAPPWGLRFEDGSTLSLLTVADGEAVLSADDAEPVTLRAGDLAVASRSTPYTVADADGTPAQLLVGEGGATRWLPGAPPEAGDRIGTGLQPNRPAGSTILLAGSYRLEGDIADRLIGELPPLLRVEAGELPAAVRELLVGEVATGGAGQQLVLERWLDIALVGALRAWFERPGTSAPGWYLANQDPAVGAALALMHDDPAHPWTLVELSERTGVSRAGLARRFGQLVGEPPMGYLTEWRITLAAERLRTGDETLETVAHHVGYSSAFALSTAFKRVRGASPSEYRRRHAPAAEPDAH